MLIEFLIAIVLVGLVVAGIYAIPKLPDIFKTIALVVAIIFLVYWILVRSGAIAYLKQIGL
jgi:hypothetical protein